ncbi:hypothetical protein ANO11243_024920 [Dothideomycetidae sp. 11243]|nr:hypothetical protein ANO11243_024920 [fungal sp. No.11243]
MSNSQPDITNQPITAGTITVTATITATIHSTNQSSINTTASSAMTATSQTSASSTSPTTSYLSNTVTPSPHTGGPHMAYISRQSEERASFRQDMAKVKALFTSSNKSSSSEGQKLEQPTSNKLKSVFSSRPMSIRSTSTADSDASSFYKEKAQLQEKPVVQAKPKKESLASRRMRIGTSGFGVH